MKPTPPPSDSRTFERALTQAIGPHTQAQPYLGDYDVVEGLVRALLSEELDRATRLGQGTLTTAVAAEHSQAAVLRMARIFTGRDPRYTPVEGWNTTPLFGSSHTLTKQIQQRLNAAVAPEHLALPEGAAQSLFALALHELRAGIQRFIADDNAEALAQLGEELADNYTRLLLGYPEDDDPTDPAAAAA